MRPGLLLVYDGRAVSERRVPAQRVIEALDVAEAGHSRLGLRTEAAAGEQLALEGREEALGHGVVVGVADRAHRGSHARLLAAAAEGQRRVLRSLVRVMDHVAGPALCHGHLQSVQNQLRTQVIGHGSADDPAAEGVKHDAEVEEARSSRHVGDIRYPEPVRGSGGKVTVDQVGSRARLSISPRRDRATTPMTGSDKASLAHQPGYAFARVPLALFAQVGVDAWRAISLVRAEMDGADSLEQGCVRCPTRRGLPASPGIVSRLRHAEHACHGSDREVGLVRVHEPEDPDGRTPVSRANQAVARERISRSSFSCRFSRRSRTSSSRSTAVRPGSAGGGLASRRPSLRSASATQLRMACAEGSNSRARSFGSRPARTNSTICRRNSAGYGGRLLGIG